MAKANKQGPQKQNPNRSTTASANTTGTNTNTSGQAGQIGQTGRTTTPKSTSNRPISKGNRPQIGGSAVPGAKSMQPKEISTTNNPQQQQAESYNRTMRRRMEQMGTTPGQSNTVQDQRRKRLEKRRKRIEERRQEVKKVTASAPRTFGIGRNVIFFLIAVAVIIIAVLVIAGFVNHIL